MMRAAVLTEFGFSAASTANADPRRDLPRYARVLENGQLDPALMIDRTFRLDEVNEALEAVANRDVTSTILAPTA